jgi:hypothetical protein
LTRKMPANLAQSCCHCWDREWKSARWQNDGKPFLRASFDYFPSLKILNVGSKTLDCRKSFGRQWIQYELYTIRLYNIARNSYENCQTMSRLWNEEWWSAIHRTSSKMFIRSYIQRRINELHQLTQYGLFANMFHWANQGSASEHC